MTDILVVDVSSANALGAAPGRASLQDDLDWDWLAQRGVRGAIVESGIGNDGVNQDLTQQLADIAAAGLIPGLYPFIYPLPADGVHPNRAPADQARLHWSQAPKLAGPHLPTFCDAEFPTPAAFARWGCTPLQIRAWLTAYRSTYSALSGETMGLYSYPDWLAETGYDPGDGPRWMAGDHATPGAILWQMTGHELMVPTRSGRPPVKTDVSLFAGTEADWARFVGIT
jgi:GH25 family lysozyme M1 (1,4-beta-N-acetylmuramidase)